LILKFIELSYLKLTLGSRRIVRGQLGDFVKTKRQSVSNYPGTHGKRSRSDYSARTANDQRSGCDNPDG
jgi:hypothetical protein